MELGGFEPPRSTFGSALAYIYLPADNPNLSYNSKKNQPIMIIGWLIFCL